MSVMLAHLYNPDRITDWSTTYVQPKLDGIRAHWDTMNRCMISRDGQVWNEPIIAHLLPFLNKLPQGLVYDGELYIHGRSLQEINSAIAVKRKQPTDLTPYVSYHIFDCLSTSPFIDRILQIYQSFKEANITTGPSIPIQLVYTVNANDENAIHHHHRNFVSVGYEGTMIRTGTLGYELKRTYSLMKLKDFIDDEFTLIGSVPGTGKYTDMLGALVCQTSSGKLFEVGTGFTDEQRTLYHNIDTSTYRRVKVKFQKLTDGKIPRHPVFICLL